MFKRDKTVMIYLIKDDKVLMLLRNKEENDINKNKYIGIGGHIEENETKEQTLIREVKEETNLDLIDYKYHGYVDFYDDDYHEGMYVYTSTNFNGILKECDEGTLYWIDKNKILDLNLWEGDKYFIELIKNDVSDFDMMIKYSKGKLIDYKRFK